jgi:Replication-relaxation
MPSDRLSRGVFEESDNYLVGADNPSVKGTDDIHNSPTPIARRIGRRQLASIKTQLSNNDLSLLEKIEKFHFSTTKQLQRLHFNQLHPTPFGGSRATTRALRRLNDLGLIERLDRRVGGVRAGSSSFIVTLSAAGSRLLGRSSRRRSFEPSLAHLAHVLDVTELVVRVHEAQDDERQVRSVETEPDCWRTFSADHGGRGLLKPDLRLVLTTGSNDLHWFVEIDRGTEHRPALVRKVSTYLAAWREGGEQKRIGVFPRVLWVVPDESRAINLRQMLSGMPQVPGGMFEVCVGSHAVAVLFKRPSV